MSDQFGQKSVVDLVDRMIAGQSDEAKDARNLRAGMLSPVIAGSLQSAVDAYEKSADATELAQNRPNAPMKPEHAAFIMEVRKEQVLDVQFLHKKFHGRA